MALNRYASFYAAYNNTLRNGNTCSKEETVKDFTGNRTGSLQDLCDEELKQLVANLNAIAGSNYIAETPAEQEKDSIRKAIISQFYTMYRTPAAAIAWAEKYGVNKQKKKFNAYTKTELMLLLINAKKVVEDWQTAMRTRAIK